MARAGAKGAIQVEPLDFSSAPPRDWRRFEWFCAEYLRVPKGHGAGDPFRLRPWQRDIAKGLLPGRGRRPRTGLVSLPRGNGKTTLAAALALYALFGDEVESPQVMVTAGTEQVARHTLKIAQRMIELNPDLAERAHNLQHSIKTPHNGGELVTTASTVAALQGFDPSLLIVDELHTVTADIWEAATSVAGKRPESLTLAISTPSDSRDSVMFDLVKLGRSGDEPSMWFREYAAPDDCDIDDEQAWKVANPAMGDFLDADGLRSVRKTMREAAFRRYRLGQWVGDQDSWLPFGSWDLCLADRELEPGERVCLGFDGSASGDSTALVAVTLDGFVQPLGIWQKNEPGWRVPRGEVSQAVDEAFEKFDVVELACDPWGWRSEIEEWSKRYGERRVTEYNTGFRKRMGPATDRMYAAVLERRLTHNGDAELARHVGNTVARVTAQGSIVSKDAKSSPRKIDAAVAAIVGFDRAHFHGKKKKRKVYSF